MTYSIVIPLVVAMVAISATGAILCIAKRCRPIDVVMVFTSALIVSLMIAAILAFSDGVNSDIR